VEDEQGSEMSRESARRLVRTGKQRCRQLAFTIRTVTGNARRITRVTERKSECWLRRILNFTWEMTRAQALFER